MPRNSEELTASAERFDVVSQVDWERFEKNHPGLLPKISNFFPWIKEYWEKAFIPYKSTSTSLPPLFHSSRVSAITGIKNRGMIAHKENAGQLGIFFVFNPLSAANHILTSSNFDTWANNPIAFDDNEKDFKDPPVIIVLDTDRFITHKRYEVSKKNRGIGWLASFSSMLTGNTSRNSFNLDSTLDRIRRFQKGYANMLEVIGIDLGEAIPSGFLNILSIVKGEEDLGPQPLSPDTFYDYLLEDKLVFYS